MIKVSVIVPVYNTSQYLVRCLNSICQQTYKDLEIIIVNDGSTDNSQSIIDRFSSNDTRIRCLSQKNQGLSAARNNALNICTGEYITFVDSDDFLDSDYIISLLNAALKHSAMISMCGWYSYEEKTKHISSLCEIINENGEVLTHQEALTKLFQDNEIQSHVWNKMYHYSLFKDVRFPVGKKFEDIYVMHKLFANANKIAYIKAPKYYYTQRDNSIIHDINKQNLTNLLCSFITRYNDTEQIVDDLDKSEQCKTIFSHYIDAGKMLGKHAVKKFYKWILIKNKELKFYKLLNKKQKAIWNLRRWGISLKIQYFIYKRFTKDKQ